MTVFQREARRKTEVLRNTKHCMGNVLSDKSKNLQQIQFLQKVSHA